MSYLFQGQRSNEEVILFTKQHPLVLVHPFLIAAGFWLIPFVLNVFLVLNGPLAFVVPVCLLLGAAKGYLAWNSWYNSVFLLTNERIVLLQQKSLVHREFAECGLHTIQQVSHEVRGLLHTLFGFGAIAVYTGGSQAPFTIPNVPDPYEVQQEILRVASGEGFAEAEEAEKEE
jgi:hypothetical protein